MSGKPRASSLGLPRLPLVGPTTRHRQRPEVAILQTMDDRGLSETIQNVCQAILDATTNTADSEPASEALTAQWPMVIQMCSLESTAREQLRDLADRLVPLREEHEWAHWIAMILTVLSDEPFVAIEPAAGLGIAGRMSGIVDNFQLHTLLMDAFPLPGGRLRKPQRRVSKTAVSVARGDGPQVDPDPVHGAWNLYTHAALVDGGFSASPDPDTWIWNEGKPADIPVLDRHRVILLGEPSYKRSWKNCRIFSQLSAGLDARVLETSEVKSWLARIAAA